jgi:hypothetical protein
MDIIAAIIVIMLLGLGFLSIRIYCFYLEFTILSKGYHTKGIVTQLKGVWSRPSANALYGRPNYSNFDYKSVIRFNDPAGKTLTKRFEEGIHGAFLVPSEGDRVHVIYYEGKIYAITFSRILLGLICSALGLGALWSTI